MNRCFTRDDSISMLYVYVHLLAVIPHTTVLHVHVPFHTIRIVDGAFLIEFVQLIIIVYCLL